MARDTSTFKRLAPRMMRDLMHDFAPLADFQAAGVAGNLGGESGGFTLAFEFPGQHKGGSGFAQWTGFSQGNNRRTVWEGHLRGMGLDPTSARDVLNYEANYSMLKKELQTTEKATILALRQTKDASEATKMFMIKFERPGVPHYEGRVSWSKMALDAYRAEEGKIAENPDVKVAKEPAQLPMPSAVPKTEKDVKGATKTVAVGGIGAALLGLVTSTWFQAALFAGVAAAVWFFLVRPIVVRYTSLGDIEAGFLTKVRVAVKGIKTKLFAGALTLSGVALPLVQYATDSNLTDALPSIKGIPPGMYMFGILALIGAAVNWLRNNTTTAPGQTDLALIPEQPAKIEPTPSFGVPYLEMNNGGGLSIDTEPSEIWTKKGRGKARKKKAKARVSQTKKAA